MDPNFLDPSGVALKDRGEFHVEAIRQHTGNVARKSSLDFLVKWTGYAESENEWVPWSQLRNNPILHEYLRANGMAKLVPKEHRA